MAPSKKIAELDPVVLLRVALLDAIAAELAAHPVAEVAARLKLSREAVLRITAGLRVHRSTAAMAATALGMAISTAPATTA